MKLTPLLLLTGLLAVSGMARNYYPQLIEEADAGNAEAQCEMGCRFSTGNCVVRSETNAIKYWTMAADQGHAAAQFWLGNYYLNSGGGIRNEKEALKWLTRSAELGNTGARQALELNFSVLSAASSIAAQTDPAKLATLKGERAANSRMQRCVYWLATAEAAGKKPEAVLDEAAKLNGTAGTPYAGFIRWGMIENLRLAKQYGILTPEGMAELRRGKSATITKGEYAGQEAEADHVIPLAVCPELRNQVMNLELLPSKLNRSKGAKIGERQKVFAKELHDAKLLSDEGWAAVERN